MKKRLLAGALAFAGAFGMVGVAGAQPPHRTGVPEHGHMKIVHAQIDVIDGLPHLVGWHRCIDLPAVGKRGFAHHASIHTGQAAAALQAAGHGVVPMAPLTDWTSCADFADDLPLPLGPPAD